jgi:hypothetical protein
MSARGLNFFENWINENIREPGQSGDGAKARELAQKLIVDAAAVGLTVADLPHDERSVEKYIYDQMTGRLIFVDMMMPRKSRRFGMEKVGFKSKNINVNDS